MIRSVFINMPVADLERSRAFFTAVGFTLNPEFESAHGLCLQLTESTAVMCTEHSVFEQMVPTPRATPGTTEAVVSLGCDSADEVRMLAERAFANGGGRVNEYEENDFMVSWAFADLDGHLWDLFWCKPAN